MSRKEEKKIPGGNEDSEVLHYRRQKARPDPRRRQMNRGIKELRLRIGLETLHGRLSMNLGVANPINTSVQTCNGYLGNSPLNYQFSISALTYNPQNDSSRRDPNAS